MRVLCHRITLWYVSDELGEWVVDLLQTVAKQLRLVIVFALVFFPDTSICQKVSNFGVPFTSYSGGTW